MPDTAHSASFIVEPVIKVSRSGKLVSGLGWCVKVLWANGSVERLYAFSSLQTAETWIRESADQWLRGQNGIN
jgi:hypothetical protein